MGKFSSCDQTRSHIQRSSFSMSINFGLLIWKKIHKRKKWPSALSSINWGDIGTPYDLSEMTTASNISLWSPQDFVKLIAYQPIFLPRTHDHRFDRSGRENNPERPNHNESSLEGHAPHIWGNPSPLTYPPMQAPIPPRFDFSYSPQRWFHNAGICRINTFILTEIAPQDEVQPMQFQLNLCELIYLIHPFSPKCLITVRWSSW